MATPNPQIQLGGLARKLVQDGLLAEGKAIDAQNASLKEKVPFVSYIVSKNLAKGKDVAKAASEEFGVPVVDIDTHPLHQHVDCIDRREK